MPGSLVAPIWAIWGGKWTDEWGYHGRPYSLDLCLPPLAVMMFKLDREKSQAVLGNADG